MSTSVVSLAGLALSVIVLASCSKGGGAPPASAPAAPAAAAPAPLTPEVRAEARELFATRCTPCHGPRGAGDGPASAGLTPRPRDFTDKAWQASVTDQHIETIIQYGGAAVAKSPAMPPNPDLTAKPDVVSALREHLRGLAL